MYVKIQQELFLDKVRETVLFLIKQYEELNSGNGKLKVLKTARTHWRHRDISLRT